MATYYKKLMIYKFKKIDNFFSFQKENILLMLLPFKLANNGHMNKY
jgi:hypothetical protein